jgi:two-component system, response regulator YesN
MYKVLLVDDEPWALVSTKNSFNWNKYHFEEPMETLNPYDAIEILCSQNIHTAFVDIRMPGISGLELIKIIKAKGIDTEFIIISGYAEFSYAQEAIREGVFDYCLKPIQPDITEQLLYRLSIHLESKQLEKDLELYDKLAKGDSDISLMFKARHFSILYPYFRVIDIRSQDLKSYEFNLELPEHSNELALWLGHHRTVRIINSNESSDTLLLKELSGTIGSSGLRVGISSFTNEISNLAQIIWEAEIAANQYFVDIRAAVNIYKVPDLSIVNNSVDKIFKNFDAYSFNDLKHSLSQILILFISNNLGLEEAFYFWNQFKAEILKQNCDPMLLRELDLPDMEDLTYRFGGLEGMFSYLTDLLLIIKKRDTYQSDASNVNDSFLKLLDHIRKNYASELYLKELATTFHINFTYCCDLFKKVTAMTFSQFLTDIRIKKAQELLINTEMQLEEIGNSIGFQDYHYFISVFKKNSSLTPSQYRKENRNSI